MKLKYIKCKQLFLHVRYPGKLLFHRDTEVEEGRVQVYVAFEVYNDQAYVRDPPDGPVYISSKDLVTAYVANIGNVVPLGAVPLGRRFTMGAGVYTVRGRASGRTLYEEEGTTDKIEYDHNHLPVWLLDEKTLDK